jgi:thioredoxin 1
MSEHTIELTDDNFEDLALKATKPVLVDFWADWCGPCRAIAPFVEQVAVEYEGRLIVGKVDTSANNELPIKYNIRGIPTLLLIKNGNVVAEQTGSLSKSQLTAFIDSNL